MPFISLLSSVSKGSGTNGKGHSDLNFESDVEAFRVILESHVALVLCPFEVSSQVWIGQAELDLMRSGGTASRWVAEHGDVWLNSWQNAFSVDGFNPFDTLAVGYIMQPGLIDCELLRADIVRYADDQVRDWRTHDDVSSPAEVPSKDYLVVSADLQSPHVVKYCHHAKEGFLPHLMSRLLR
jgi:inosine-uridine nucleoside N-ribohydrolase